VMVRFPCLQPPLSQFLDDGVPSAVVGALLAPVPSTKYVRIVWRGCCGSQVGPTRTIQLESTMKHYLFSTFKPRMRKIASESTGGEQSWKRTANPIRSQIRGPKRTSGALRTF